MPRPLVWRTPGAGGRAASRSHRGTESGAARPWPPTEGAVARLVPRRAGPDPEHRLGHGPERSRTPQALYPGGPRLSGLLTGHGTEQAKPVRRSAFTAAPASVRVSETLSDRDGSGAASGSVPGAPGPGFPSLTCSETFGQTLNPQVSASSPARRE